MSVKKYRIILLCIIVLIIIATLICTFYKTSANENENAKQAEVITSEYMYFIKEYDGQIGVFRNKEDKPFRMVEVYTFNLPPADQQMLQEGIMIADDAKLASIIEDYES